MSIIIHCDVCGGQVGGAGIPTNPDAMKIWTKEIKRTLQGKKFLLTVSLQADLKDGSNIEKDFEHICNPCARDRAKFIVGEIVNA